MSVEIDDRLKQGKMDEFTGIELQDIAAKLDEIDRMKKPLQQTQSLYSFLASKGEWWVRKIFDLKLRIFFSIDKNGDIWLEWIDRREDDTYDEAEQQWKMK